MLQGETDDLLGSADAPGLKNTAQRLLGPVYAAVVEGRLQRRGSTDGLPREYVEAENQKTVTLPDK